MLNVFYVIEPGSRIIYRKGSVIVVRRSGEKVVMPPNTEKLVIASSRVGITSMVIRHLASRGVDVVFLDPTGYPIAMVFPPVLNKTVITRVRQYEVYLNREFVLSLARKFIYCKIENQARLLRFLGKSRREDWLIEVAFSISSLATQLMSIKVNELGTDVINSYEAQAAKKYWEAVASLLPHDIGFTGRDQEGNDPINASLNYGYGILYSIAEKDLLIAGLDPYLGVLHTLKSGKASLVFDFVEMFRPVAVDKAVITGVPRLRLNVVNGLLDYESRKAVAKVVIENLNKQYPYSKVGRNLALVDIIKHEAWDLASLFRTGSINDYQCYLAVL